MLRIGSLSAPLSLPLAVVLVFTTAAAVPVHGQVPSDPTDQAERGDSSDIPGVTPVEPGVTPVEPGVTPAEPGVTPVEPGVTPVEIEQWIAELGAREFAVRERAADRLTQIGTAIVPQLRGVAADAEDPEIRLRAAEIVRQLSEGNQQARIDSFLAGEEVDFEGWQVIRGFFGDTHGARELFVELMTQHPLLTQSLEQETRDRVVAMDAVMSRVQDAMTIERRFPNRADAFALLLTAADPKVPINSGFESMLLSVLNQSAVRDIRRDWQLKRPFEDLLAQWMMRSSIANRRAVLEVGMRMELPTALDLALQTLSESNESSTLTAAMQVISRFGEKRHAEMVRPLLEDKRLLAARGIANGEGFSTQLGDVAMATIAMLHKMPLEELGYRDVQLHPAIGFGLDGIGFYKQEHRETAQAKIQELLKNEP